MQLSNGFTYKKMDFEFDHDHSELFISSDDPLGKIFLKNDDNHNMINEYVTDKFINVKKTKGLSK